MGQDLTVKAEDFVNQLMGFLKYIKTQEPDADVYAAAAAVELFRRYVNGTFPGSEN